jgi:hypothetical protein
MVNICCNAASSKKGRKYRRSVNNGYLNLFLYIS